MSAAASSEPAMIGRFVVRALLQKGPPRVVRAFDPRPHREVRLKIYPKTGDDGRQVETLNQSHAAAMEVRHPAIIPVFEIGTADQGAYAAGALPAGKRLVEILADRPLGPRRAAVVGKALAEGMAAAHERGFAHGDIHPAGVFLDPDGGAAWVDFGASADDGPANPAYCAPERLSDPPGAADAASDQYGLGVLLFEMLTGQTPFSDDAETDAEARVAEPTPSARTINGKIDRDLDAICRKAMSPDTDDRYASCQDLADDLWRWLEKAPVRARPAGRFRRLISNWWLTSGLLAAALLAAGTLATLLILQQSTIAKLKEARDRAERSTLPKLPDPLPGRGPTDAAQSAAKLQAREKELAEVNFRLMQAESKHKEEKAKIESDKKEEAQARSDLEATLYCENILRSHEFWQKQDPARAQSYLKACEPREKKRPDWRNWEWQFLRRRFQPPKTFTLKGEDGIFGALEPRAADGTDLRASVCAYSPDGTRLAYCLRDDRAIVWNALVGETVATTDRHRGAICDLVFAPDGARFVTVGADKIARVWQSTGELVKNLREHGDAITAVAFRPDGQMMATASADRTIRLWNPIEFESTRTLTGHERAVLAAAFNPDGKLLASGDADGTIRVWDTADGQNKLTLTGHAGPVHAVCFSPDGQRLASAGEDHTVRLWDVNAGKEIRTLSRHNRAVKTVAFRPDGKQIASAGDDRCVCIWDAGGNLLTMFQTGHADSINRLAYRSDSRQFATASLDQSIKLWDAQRPVATEGRSLSGHTEAITVLARSPDGKTLATGGADKTVRIWDIQSGELARTIEGHTGTVRGLAYTSDSSQLASCSDDGTIRIWDPATGQLVRNFGGHTGAVHAVAFSPDGSQLASAGADGAVRIRQAATGQALINCEGHRGGAIDVVFNGDGTRILTCGADGSARFWDARTGDPLTEIQYRASEGRTVAPPGARWREGAAAGLGHPARIAISPKNQRCAVVERHGTIRVIDTTTMGPIADMAGHDQTIQCLAFSGDGRRLVSGDVAGTIKVWDCKTGLEVLSLDAHAGRVSGLAFSRDGRLLFSAGADRVIRIWDGSPEDPNAKPRDGEETTGN